MNNLKNYFSSPEKSATVVPSQEVSLLAVEPQSAILLESEKDVCSRPASPIISATSPFPYVVKTPRADSKLILQNMEEVLNSVKKKHRQKHRRKKEQKKRAQMEAAAMAELSALTNGGEKGENNDKTNGDETENINSSKMSKKTPLQESTEQGISRHRESVFTASLKQKSSSSTESTGPSIHNNFSKTPKTEQSTSNGCSSSMKSNKANAFEVMMNARNKSIGSNTPGKEALDDEVAKSPLNANVKRKMFLQEWAERKGGIKRKLEDDARQAYIEKQLNRRAKRFKKMLVSPNDITSPMNEMTSTTAKEKVKPKSATTASKPRRKARRSSVERLSSVDSIEQWNTASQDSSSGFLSKLSSPVKKRDSLLGYFPKIESSTETTPKNTPNPISQRKKRGKGKLSVSDDASPPPFISSGPDNASVSTRPKRSCSGKARYDFDLLESPIKDEKRSSTSTPVQNKTRRSSRTPAISSTPTTIVEIDVINVDESLEGQNISSTTASANITATPKKLAPLFVRSMPKPSPNPDVIHARKQFLMSGVPEKMRLEQAKQKKFEQTYEDSIKLFPSISHVRQFTDEENDAMLNTRKVFSLRVQDDAPTSSPRVQRRFKSKSNRTCIGNITSCTAKDFRMNANKFRGEKNGKWDPMTSILPQIENKRRIIKNWKMIYDRFPTYKCYNQMREKYRFFCAIDSAQDTEQVTESFVVTRKTRRSMEAKKFDPDAEEAKPPLSAPNGELLFTEKYKPMLSEQVLVNLTPVNQLRDFLASWNTAGGGGSGNRISATTNESMQDSDIANDSSSSFSAASPSVVLLGPGSSGKTNAVFALANEMNFNVLEINAGMKRTGKKLLQELQEATQSHQIRKEATTSKGRNNNLLKYSLNGLKTKQKQQQQTAMLTTTPAVLSADDCNSSSVDLSQSVRKSLILVEDADIIFDQYDAGFVDAIYTLAATSKRPVIIVASNPNCQHLQRLINQNVINFSSANVLNISKFLSVLSLIENCPIHLNDLVSLYLYNRKDLRKTILELQFFIQSGGDRKNPQKGNVYQKQQQQKGLFFTSPSKRRFSEENVLDGTAAATAICSTDDDELGSNSQRRKKSEDQELYVHRNFFEFYTVCQNSSSRIPYPVDFGLLHLNLNDIFKTAKNLQAEQPSVAVARRRKSRSPKKTWLNAAQSPPMQHLCEFYENISIAALLSSSESDDTFADRLIPHMAEDISHSLVERAINCNLASGSTPYNLFDSPKESYSLATYQPTILLRTGRSLALDYEPALRSICRSEKTRSTAERRGSRFYHYLRNCSANLGNFSTEYFENSCSILWEQDSHRPPTTPPK